MCIIYLVSTHCKAMGKLTPKAESAAICFNLFNNFDFTEDTYHTLYKHDTSKISIILDDFGNTSPYFCTFLANRNVRGPKVVIALRSSVFFWPRSFPSKSAELLKGGII